MTTRFLVPDERDALLVRAAIGRGDDALAAWNAWYEDVVLDDIEYSAARVLTAVFANIQAHGRAGSLPPRLRGKYRWTWASNQLRVTAVAPAIRALQSAGAEPVLLKGAALLAAERAKWGAREMGDVDLLVPVDALDRAARALVDAGWKPVEGVTAEEITDRFAVRRHGWNFEGPERGELDLHWHRFEGMRATGTDRSLWSRARAAELGGIVCSVPDDTDQLLQVIEHASHGEPAHRLQWLIDAAALVDHVDAIDLVRRARACALQQCVVDALAILAATVATPKTSELERCVSASRAGWRDRALQMSERTSARAPVRRQASELVRAAVVNGVSLRHALRGASAIARRRFEPSLRRSPVLGSLPALSPRLRRLEVGWIRRFGPIARPPAPAPVPRGTWIDLTDAHWRAAVAGPGWSWPELDGGGIWADGSEARLVLDVDIPRGEDVLLEFELGRHADVSPNPFVTVFVNARPVTGWELEAHSERGPRRVEIPAWLADWCRPIEVTFRPREAFDPGCRSGVNDDRWFVPVTRVRVSAARDARAEAADGTQLAV